MADRKKTSLSSRYRSPEPYRRRYKSRSRSPTRHRRSSSKHGRDINHRSTLYKSIYFS
ncbi:hypothetical protein BCV71DRAFT_225669 [Rhizopus microsporus]|uniref:Uncharacterized protein n=1 Tax=Rhizopus microsporus TaxID=58291 RepID=A0A1X0S8D3_RHIZD|nr:hypothetical protein BCV71DRAFT_225669 [Rhizopus microsporus]